MLSVVERVNKNIVFNFQVVFFTEPNTHMYTLLSVSVWLCDLKVNLAKKVNGCRFSLFKFPYKSQNMCFRFD